MINYSDLFEKRSKSNLKASDISFSSMPSSILLRITDRSLAINQFELNDFSQTASMLDALDPFEDMLKQYAEERVALLATKFEGSWDDAKETRLTYLSELIEKYHSGNREIDLQTKYALLIESLELLKSTSEIVRHYKKKLK